MVAIPADGCDGKNRAAGAAARKRPPLRYQITTRCSSGRNIAPSVMPKAS